MSESDVTQILAKLESGDQQASEDLLPLVYDELRKLAAARMAAESPDHTLQATALVHEAYVRLVDVAEAQNWDSRGHFLAAASAAMRRILVEGARRKKSLRRGGDVRRHSVDVDQIVPCQRAVDIVELDDALSKLGAEKPAVAKLVELRYFAGLTLDEAAATLGVSSRTADTYWAYAKGWLHQELGDGDA